MVFVLAALLSKFAFIAINILWMRLRRRHVAARAILALYVFSVPVLITVGAWQIWRGEANLEPAYWGYVAAWAVICCILNLLSVYTYKYASLIELSTYRFAIMVVIAFIGDYFFLHTPISLPMAVMVLVTLAGGVILNFERGKFLQKDGEKPRIKDRTLYKVLALVTFISLLSVIDLAIFKEALAIQNNFVFHAAAAQTILFVMFFTYGGPAMAAALRERKVHVPEVALITAIIIVATMLEAYSFSELPLVIIVLLGVCQPLAFSIHDFVTKDMPLNAASVISCLMVVAGIVGILIVKSGIS